MSFLGVPYLHPIILPLDPCPFWGGTPVTGPRSLPRGVPQHGIPPSQVRMGVPQDRVSPWPGMGYTAPHPGMGYTAPQPGIGYPLGENSRGSTCYVAGRMPLAFTQEDFLVFILKKNSRYFHKIAGKITILNQNELTVSIQFPRNKQSDVTVCNVTKCLLGIGPWAGCLFPK